MTERYIGRKVAREGERERGRETERVRQRETEKQRERERENDETGSLALSYKKKKRFAVLSTGCRIC